MYSLRMNEKGPELNDRQAIHIHPKGEGEYKLIEARDGRRIEVIMYGPEWGVPVVSLAGNPGHAGYPRPDKDMLDMLGVRYYGINRGGFGGTDCRPGLRVIDAAVDVEDAMSMFGVERYGVLARSGGVPGALAVAACNQGVTALVPMAGLAPPDADIDWLQGMTEDNRKKHLEARFDQDAFVRSVHAHVEELHHDPNALLSKLWPDFMEADMTALHYDCLFKEEIALGHSLGIADGQGWIDHTLSLHQPWGFDVSSIKVPTIIWHGAQDPFASIEHSRWLHRNIKGSVLIESPFGSHFTAFQYVYNALQFIRDMHIGEQRAQLIEPLVLRRTQEFYGPNQDLTRPVSDRAFMLRLSRSASTPLREAVRDEEDTTFLRRILGDRILYPLVVKEVIASSDEDLARAYPDLWGRSNPSPTL